MRFRCGSLLRNLHKCIRRLWIFRNVTVNGIILSLSFTEILVYQEVYMYLKMMCSHKHKRKVQVTCLSLFFLRKESWGLSAGTGKHCILFTWDYSLFGVLLCSVFCFCCFTSFVLWYPQKEPKVVVNSKCCNVPHP